MFLISYKIITVNICRVMLNKTGERGHVFLDHECLWDALNCSPLHTLMDFALLYMILGFPGGTSDKEHTCQCRRRKRHRLNPFGQECPLEDGMATHSGILAWRIPWTEKSDGLQSIGLQTVGHDGSDLAHMHT